MTDFANRIEKHRATFLKQTDDYYGDKVNSLSTYAQWLRDQRRLRKLETKPQDERWKQENWEKKGSSTQESA